MAFNFIADHYQQGKTYPALAKWQAQPYTARWREFAQHAPYTVPNDLIDYCNQHSYPYTINTQLPAWYIVSLGWFDHTQDYFHLMNSRVMAQLKNKELQVLFYYHEGDNPERIKQRLDLLCWAHELDADCYRFVSANTAADHVPGFAYFPCHELIYWSRNSQQRATAIHARARPYEFTVLNRTHKWWRATVMADLYYQGLLTNSQWSYNTSITITDSPEDNPIEIDTLGLRDAVTEFVQAGPYACDRLTAAQHNDHHLHVAAHYTESYCSIILETHFDCDQSGGAFLTEKTFKCLKHGHPFVIIGAQGSLQALRDLGYRTFDHCIDNTYDTIVDNTQRYCAALAAVKQLQAQDMQAWFLQCVDDVTHNQQLFCAGKRDRLNILDDKLLY